VEDNYKYFLEFNAKFEKPSNTKKETSEDGLKKGLQLNSLHFMCPTCFIKRSDQP
jgi:hypothetical protein